MRRTARGRGATALPAQLVRHGGDARTRGLPAHGAKLPDRHDGDEVIVVDAGMAGLAAAWRLRQAGVRVRVIEANDRIGGRMVSLRGFFPDAQVVELGGQLIDSDHARIRGAARDPVHHLA